MPPIILELRVIRAAPVPALVQKREGEHDHHPYVVLGPSIWQAPLLMVMDITFLETSPARPFVVGV
jgi:hypothetical protein